MDLQARFTIDDVGWLTSVKRVLSPNADERPESTDINLLVIHGISLPEGCFDGEAVQALFMNQLKVDTHPSFAELADVRVSAHVVIRRNGEVTQYVPFEKRAWHCGESVFEGRTRCNDFSVGIELEGCVDVPYSMAQYLRLVMITRALQQRYPFITRQRITSHHHIAPDRRWDPGPRFDWQLYAFLLGEQ